MTAHEPVFSAATPTSKNRGCLFWALILAVVVAGGGYLVYRYAIEWIVIAYTGVTPLDLGEPALSPGELGAIDGRLATFAHAVRNKTPVEPIVLTSEELTALVVRIPEFRRLGGRARFSIGDGEIRGEFSLPLERMGYPDRWFNCAAAFTAALENGLLIVRLRSASVRGEPVPGWIVWTLRNRNLAKELYEQPLAASLIARLESIDVVNDRVTVVPRLRR
ncbi:MAG TPA: hypothetical protein VLF14_06295 [Candidatus Binatia bacterium]|nr:hypothetical protein [Candidatus Binatia bacterium]